MLAWLGAGLRLHPDPNTDTGQGPRATADGVIDESMMMDGSWPVSMLTCGCGCGYVWDSRRLELDTAPILRILDTMSLQLTP